VDLSMADSANSWKYLSAGNDYLDRKKKPTV
jgi:hypothetical protein